MTSTLPDMKEASRIRIRGGSGDGEGAVMMTGFPGNRILSTSIHRVSLSLSSGGR